MSDYELVSVLIEYINTTWAIFATYVSVVFAFLVAGYFAAKKLASTMVSLVITLYTLVVIWSVFALNRNVASIGAATDEIKRVVREGESSLSWVPLTSTPDFLSSAMPIMVTGLAVVAYVGSLLFFFHQRKDNLSIKNE
jgi:general stress protein CsbA